MTIRYHSTNRANGGRPGDTVPFREALFQGLAPDGGLYLPDRLPLLTRAELDALRDRPYAEVAFRVLRPFVEGDLADDAFLALCRDAYDFEVPLEPFDEGVWILRLDRGPTASFKDFAARWMARVMRALRPAGRPITVLVATSGDTGSAVGEAYRGLDGVRVVILYPEREVSPVQKRQLDSIGANVASLSVAGTFDECQHLVKQAFLDPAHAALNLTSANSINIGRILPQSVYYVYAWLRASHGFHPVTFSIPSGNFGNSFGGELARRMGVPLGRLIVAVNENDEFPRFLESGAYAPVCPSRACLSNAMNVGNPSNLARYFDLYGGTLTRDGVVRRMPDVADMRRRLASVSVSDAETVDTIRRAWNDRRVLLEPHGAVGVAALTRCAGPGERPAVCIETAHPAKFPEIVERELGFAPEPSEALRRLDARRGEAQAMAASYEALSDYLRGMS